MFGQTNYTPIRPNLYHTNGLLNFTDHASTNSVTPFRVNNPWQPNELLDAFMDQPLKFETGFPYEYSYTNYVILGIILEKVGG
jgi:CubicO group peptidase (beta-lactamase class C family)